jgi:sulfofructose kinase
MNPKVVGIGDLCLDIIASVDRIPATDMMEPLTAISCQGGGKVPTAMVTLSRLGVKAGLIATVGDDSAGRFCLKELSDSGVDTSCMVVLDNTRTNLSICLAEKSTQGRSFIGKYDMRTILPDELPRKYIENASFLHLWQMTPAALLAADWIHQSGGQVVFDADRYNNETKDNLNKIDIFIGSEFFYNGMFGDDFSEQGLKKNLSIIREIGPEIVLFTRGTRGFFGMDENGFFYGPAHTNIDVVDTTGAGDVYHGAFIYGLLQGWGACEAAEFSSAVSAIKCTAIGGRTGIPDLRTVEKFIKTGIIDRTVIEYWERYYQHNSLI